MRRVISALWETQRELQALWECPWHPDTALNLVPSLLVPLASPYPSGLRLAAGLALDTVSCNQGSHSSPAVICSL